MKNLFPYIFFAIITGFFFSPFIFSDKLPVPADTIVGLYHPFRDIYSSQYPNGVPYKNFLITDPVRQLIPWKEFTVYSIKHNKLPTWNPYSFAGTPHLANFQTGVFYPFNFLFFLFPFMYAWGIFILVQPFLMGIFLYLYLRNLGLHNMASVFGGIIFAFSGFSVAWMQWGNILHTALWLPLVLLSIDKIMHRIKNYKPRIRDKSLYVWCLIFIFSLSSSLFAGHLQTFFYLFLLSIIYLLSRCIQFGVQVKSLGLFASGYFIFGLLTVVQWLPSLNFIFHSGRNVDQNWQISGWFLPWQHLVQFVAPDFFGNPATLNYWGVWNYAEFVGYIGIIPLIFALSAMFHRRDKKTFFFTALFVFALIFSLPTIFAKIPYLLSLPFLSTAQPTRLIFVTDFSLSVLAGLGLDQLLRNSRKNHTFLPFIFLTSLLIILWGVVSGVFENAVKISSENIMIARRNIILPTVLAFFYFVIFQISHFYFKNRFKTVLAVLIFSVTLFDLLRFANKFTPFTERDYFFPNTKAVKYLQNETGEFRVMSVDERIFPPNFSVIYRIESVEGYDPLYLRRYGELIAASERNKPDISPPFGFNRIITPKNFESRIIDLLGVKYILSLGDLETASVKKIFEEGQTKIYENTNAFGRVFLVEEVAPVSGKEEGIRMIFDEKIDLRKTAVVENWKESNIKYASGSARITLYQEQNVIIDIVSDDESFLVLMDSYYPTWRAKVCDIQMSNCRETEIHLTNYNFRGVIVPGGAHKVVFENHLL